MDFYLVVICLVIFSIVGVCGNIFIKFMSVNGILCYLILY